MSIKKTASKKPEKKLKDEECFDCPAKDFCDDEKNIFRLKDKKAQAKAKEAFEKKHSLKLDELFKNASFEVIKEEDLPDDIKQFVGKLKGQHKPEIIKEIVETGKDADKIIPLADEFSKKVYETGFRGKISIKTTSQEELDAMKKAHFCSHCGRKMIERDVPAEKYNRLIKAPNHPTIHSYLPNKAFDDKTGKKLYVKQYICPKYYRPFGTHDCFSIGEPFTK